MRREELLHIIMLFLRTERTRCGNQTIAATGGQLCVNRIPMLLDIVPRLLTRFACLQQNGEQYPTVLVANFACSDIIQRTFHQRRVFKRRQ